MSAWWWDGVRPDPARDQHFLADEGRLAALVAAAGVHPGDRVLELGAGIGTVAAAIVEAVPGHRSLTLVEADATLVAILERRFPDADVRCADALAVTDPCDVLLANLPGMLTERLLAGLGERVFRTAMLTLPEGADVPGGEHVLTLEPADFRPPQERRSTVWRLGGSEPASGRPPRHPRSRG